MPGGEFVMTIPTKEKENKANIVSMRQLLESGVHFGHQTKRWNPKMKKYIFTARNGIHVIDLQESIKLIKQSYICSLFSKEVSFVNTNLF